MIVDSLMNLPLFDQAAALPGGDPAWRDLATQHALTVSRTNQRPDGSIAHVAAFDPATGAFLKRDTWQGATPDSTWSPRAGLGDPRVRGAGPRVGEPRAPGGRGEGRRLVARPHRARAARAGLGLLAPRRGARLLRGRRRRVRPPRPGRPDRRPALPARPRLQTLDELAAKHVAPTGPALLTDAVGNLPDGGEVGGGLVYGDYYFLEAGDRRALVSRSHGVRSADRPGAGKRPAPCPPSPVGPRRPGVPWRPARLQPEQHRGRRGQGPLLARELKEQAPDLDGPARPHRVRRPRPRIARERGADVGRWWSRSSGDGGYNEVVNGAMAAGNRRTPWSP